MTTDARNETDQPPGGHVSPPADHAETAKTVIQRIADLRAWLFLAALILGFEIWSRVSFGGTFIFNPFNITSIAIFAVAPLLLATGQTFVIITGGIDLSMGFIMGLAAVVAAHVINWATPGMGMPLAVLFGALVAIGVAMIPGYINGILVSRLRVPPFIINLRSHLLKLNTLSGMCAGLAGFLYAARFSAGAAQAGEPLLLDSVAAVVIGGASLFGGSGTILGTVAGAFVIAVIQYGLVFINVEPFWQFISVGVVIIISVLIDQAQRRISGGRQSE